MTEILELKRALTSIDSDRYGFEMGSNISFVVDADLCHGCGACDAVCPESAISMEFNRKKGIYLAEIDDKKCTNCRYCVEICPGYELDLTDRSWGEVPTNSNKYVGPYESIVRGFSTDSELRERAASGGAATEIVKALLERGLVDKAILVGMSETNPTFAETYITSNIDSLAKSQKSKYSPVPVNSALRPLIHNWDGDRYVFVGLPNHVHGLRQIQRVFPHMRKAVPYVVSLFTAHTPSQLATDFILYKKRVVRSDVSRLEYRGGGNPGRMKIVVRSGQEILVPHLSWIYSGHSFPLFFYPVREWLYFDKMSEWADFSCGDNWMGGSSEQKGVSTIVTRSIVAENIVRSMAHEGRLYIKNMTADDLIKDQGLRTKLNIGPRLRMWRSMGNAIPKYSRIFEPWPGQLLRTYRFAKYVQLSEKGLPFWLMNMVIFSDYYFRAFPRKILRRIGELLAKPFVFFTRLPPLVEEEALAKKVKIALIGGYGHQDIGDEAMPHAVREKLRSKFGDRLELVMLSFDPASTELFHGEKAVPDFPKYTVSIGENVKRTAGFFVLTPIIAFAAFLQSKGIRIKLWQGARASIDAIAMSDALFNVGGGNINSIMPTELYRKCTAHLVARILGKPSFLSGQTFGPFTNIFDSTYARFCLNGAKIITFRDKDTSFQRLQRIGVRKPVMFDAADDAITLSGVPRELASKYIYDEFGIDVLDKAIGPIVYLNIKASLRFFSGSKGENNLSSEIKLLANIADRLVEFYGCKVILFPSDFSPGVDDRVPHAAVLELVVNKKHIYSLVNTYTDEDMIGMIALADAVIGGRYHFNVFAASVHTPFLGLSSGLYQMTKLSGLANLCGLPQCFVNQDMREIQIDKVWQQVSKLMEERRSIRQHLEKVVPELKLCSNRIFDMMEGYL